MLPGLDEKARKRLEIVHAFRAAKGVYRHPEVRSFHADLPISRAYRAFPALSLAYPAAKPLKPLVGPISGLGGAFLPTFFIAKPLRGCLRGRSGRARGPQATGGPGGGTPRRARSALGAGRVGRGGTVRPPLGGTIEGRGSREAGEPRRGAPCRQARQHQTGAKFSTKTAAQLQVKN